LNAASLLMSASKRVLDLAQAALAAGVFFQARWLNLLSTEAPTALAPSFLQTRPMRSLERDDLGGADKGEVQADRRTATNVLPGCNLSFPTVSVPFS